MPRRRALVTVLAAMYALHLGAVVARGLAVRILSVKFTPCFGAARVLAAGGGETVVGSGVHARCAMRSSVGLAV